MKGQFISTEELAIRFPPFINSTTGAEITGDACTILVKKPDGTTATYTSVTTPAVTFDAGMGVWLVNIPTASYMATSPYEWRVKATSDDVTALPQRKIYYWGDWVQATASIAAVKAKTDLIPAAPASEATSTAIKAKTDLIPAAPASEVTTEAARVAAVAAAADALIARKILTGRFKIDTTAKTLTLYDTNGTTPLYVYNLKDETGTASALRIFERVIAP